MLIVLQLQIEFIVAGCVTQALLQEARGKKTLETRSAGERSLLGRQSRRATSTRDLHTRSKWVCMQDSAPWLSSERLRRHLLSYSIINARSPPVRSLVRIGVLLAERLQVVGVRLAAAQRATRYLGGNRVLLSGLPA